jgi:hypothetical protein
VGVALTVADADADTEPDIFHMYDIERKSTAGNTGYREEECVQALL